MKRQTEAGSVDAAVELAKQLFSVLQKSRATISEKEAAISLLGEFKAVCTIWKLSLPS